MIGNVISDRYVVQDEGIRGGMATVYRAYDKVSKRDVAIKLLHEDILSIPGMAEQFRIEANAAIMVSHTGIVKLYDVGQYEDVPYIVMEYIKGITLKKKIRTEKHLHQDVALSMTLRILAAVGHAHDNGIIHRDIKPQNILVTKDDRVKVADFGIARITTPTHKKDGKDEPLMGSVHYLSPEQLAGKTADARSDLYSVGVVLYEMLTGKVPYPGNDPETVKVQQKEKPKRPSRLQPGVCRSMDEVVLKALRVDPDQRYQTAREMAEDLQKVAAQPNGGVVQTEKEKKPRRALLIGAVLLVLAAALGTLGVYMRDALTHVVMPDVLGSPAAETISELEEMGLVCVSSNHYSDDYPAGTIAAQAVSAGERLEKGSRVELIISDGSEWYELPDLTGMRESDARKLVSGNIRFEYIAAEAEPGTIVSQSAPAGRRSREEEVTVYVSAEDAWVPSLSGLSLEGAVSLLEAEGLRVGAVTESHSEDSPADMVIGQTTEPGTQVPAGTAIDLIVSRTRDAKYYPDLPFNIAVPMDNVYVEVEVVSPSGASRMVCREKLAAGTYKLDLSDDEPGEHTVTTYMNGILMETTTLMFE